MRGDTGFTRGSDPVMKTLVATDGSEMAIDAAPTAQDVLAPMAEVILLSVLSDVPGVDVTVAGQARNERRAMQSVRGTAAVESAYGWYDTVPPNTTPAGFCW